MAEDVVAEKAEEVDVMAEKADVAAVGVVVSEAVLCRINKTTTNYANT